VCVFAVSVSPNLQATCVCHRLDLLFVFVFGDVFVFVFELVPVILRCLCSFSCSTSSVCILFGLCSYSTIG